MNAQEATKRRPTQASRPSLHFKEPFTVDVIARALGRTILRPEFVAAFPALLYWLDRRASRKLFTLGVRGHFPPLASFNTLKFLLTKAYPVLGLAWFLALLRLINSAFERYAGNLGEWRADKPQWEKEVVVVTGGARGIGAKIVELLSHEKGAKVAVLDLGEPEYAPAPSWAPDVQYYKVRR